MFVCVSERVQSPRTCMFVCFTDLAGGVVEVEEEEVEERFI